MQKLLQSAFLFLLSIGAWAQTPTPLPDVTVYDNRVQTTLQSTARNVSVIGFEEIRQMPVQNLNDLLQYVAGVDFRQRGAWGGQADVSIRGGSFDQCLVLWNGIKMNDPQTGHHTMNLGIDINSIVRIEILKGPAAARYGLNAYSGVINIITRPEAVNVIDVRASAGQAEASSLPGPFYGGGQLALYGNHHYRNWSQSVSVTGTQSTGYRPGTDLKRESVTYEGYGYSRLGQLQVMFMGVKNAFGASGYYAFPIDSTSSEEVRTMVSAVQYTKRFQRWLLTGKAYIRKNFDTYTLFREVPSIYQNRHRTDVGGGEAHLTYTYGIGIAGLGLEYREEGIRSNNLGSDLRRNFGLFADHMLYLLDGKFKLRTAAYLNYNPDFGVQFLPSINISQQIKYGVNLFASYGQSFRLPTYTDLHYVGPTNVGNPNLRPEKLQNVEAGVKWRRHGQFFQGSVYYQDARDLIDWVRDSVTQPWTPMNHDRVKTIGLDVNHAFTLALRLPGEFQFSMLRVAYNGQRPTIASGNEVISNYALTSLRHQVVFQTTFSWRSTWSFSPSVRYVERISLGDYWLVDARLKYQRTGFSCWFDVTNILDQAYVEASAASMPGRWYRFGVGFQLAR